MMPARTAATQKKTADSVAFRRTGAPERIQTVARTSDAAMRTKAATPDRGARVPRRKHFRGSVARDLLPDATLKGRHEAQHPCADREGEHQDGSCRRSSSASIVFTGPRCAIRRGLHTGKTRTGISIVTA